MFAARCCCQNRMSEPVARISVSGGGIRNVRAVNAIDHRLYLGSFADNKHSRIGDNKAGIRGGPFYFEGATNATP